MNQCDNNTDDNDDTNDTNDTNDNMCPICYEQLDSQNTQILSCGHKFHLECIKNAYITQKGLSRLCPYCRKYGGYLKLEPSTIPIKNIHKEYTQFKESEKLKKYESLKPYLDNKKCFAILKSGVNKGKQCRFNKMPGCYFCKKHNK